MNLPIVSVIIPNYNHAAFLEQRITSVLQQTFQDFEVIILDDCSTDSSRDIIERYRQHPKVSQIIYNTTNSGSVFKQWKKGIEAAAGQYIWLAESDDWCEPTLLQYLTTGLLQNRQNVLAYCQSYAIDGDNKVFWQTQHGYLEDTIEGQQFIQQYMVDRNAIVNASMAVWKKELFAGLQQDYLEYKFAGDKVFWINLCRQGNVFITARVLNYFRSHGGDVSTPAYRSGLNFIEDARILHKLNHEMLIPANIYKKALRKLHRQFWEQRGRFEPAALEAIEQGFYRTPGAVIPAATLKRDARWKLLRMQLKKVFSKR